MENEIKIGFDSLKEMKIKDVIKLEKDFLGKSKIKKLRGVENEK